MHSSYLPHQACALQIKNSFFLCQHDSLVAVASLLSEARFEMTPTCTVNVMRPNKWNVKARRTSTLATSSSSSVAPMMREKPGGSHDRASRSSALAFFVSAPIVSFLFHNWRVENFNKTSRTSSLSFQQVHPRLLLQADRTRLTRGGGAWLAFLLDHHVVTSKPRIVSCMLVRGHENVAIHGT